MRAGCARRCRSGRGPAAKATKSRSNAAAGAFTTALNGLLDAFRGAETVSTGNLSPLAAAALSNAACSLSPGLITRSPAIACIFVLLAAVCRQPHGLGTGVGRAPSLERRCRVAGAPQQVCRAAASCCRNYRPRSELTGRGGSPASGGCDAPRRESACRAVMPAAAATQNSTRTDRRQTQG